MSGKAVGGERAARFQKVFDAYLRGSRPVSTVAGSQLFLEAAREHPTPSLCIEKISTSSHGLRAVRNSVRASADPRFLIGHVFPFIAYLADPDVKAIAGGRLLDQIIVTLVDPPTAWSLILQLYLDDGFPDSEARAQTFAWLCLEIASSRSPELMELKEELRDALEKRPLLDNPCARVREYGYQVRTRLGIQSSADPALTSSAGTETPGGRHDNDFADYREISVYPTTDELVSTLRPFYRRAAEVEAADPEQRASHHLDNQYRLLREDMLAELREDIQIATGKKKSRRVAQAFGKLGVLGLDTGDDRRGRQCTLLVTIGSGLQVLQGKSAKQRMSLLKDQANILRHQAFAALCSGEHVLGFAFVHRDIDRLVEDPPVVGLQFTSSEVLIKVFNMFRTSKDNIRFVLVDTPVFAYEPVLERLKDITELPLQNQILLLGDSNDDGMFSPPKHLQGFIENYQQICSRDNQREEETTLEVGKQRFTLDTAQLDALIYALGSPLAIIQGPPGTGKSFIGALAAKRLLSGGSCMRILLISYTNHALDQFLGDLMNIGVHPECMTRLGSKSSTATVPLLFESQFRECEARRSKEANLRLRQARFEVNETREEIQDMLAKVTGRVSWMDILEHLKFSDDPADQVFLGAFQVPVGDGSFTLVGRKGGQIKEDYLIHRWQQGKGDGAFQGQITDEYRSVWSIPPRQRTEYVERWVKSLRRERHEILRSLIERSNATQRKVDDLFNEAKCDFIAKKRVVGCTTTAAAKYSSLIKRFRASCVLVEEAGEIQEAHILTALGSETKQLILIGDHKQLRPKCNNYALSVEKGDGYDLNRSMFERLILKGHRHVTLRRQHRMDPEISQLVRAMTYPELLDDAKTKGRSPIRGISGRVVFINHSWQEVVSGEIQDSLDVGYKASKKNKSEAEMVLKLVRYLGQQGYKTSDIVVLTPYLGQLRLLRDMLSKDSDPLLSDLDSFELIRAGLLTSAAGNVDKGKIRLSTIDNYQGEESKVVIASLTRSNEKGDIGFMKAAERLNVLVSRARDGLIMLGNMDTFMNSPQGKDTWVPFFRLLREKGYLKDGISVRCERHPERTAMLSSPQDFDQKCPDGGCSEPCGEKLKCGAHTCQRRCHRLSDHANIPCNKLIDQICDKGHKYKVRCEEKHVRCGECCKQEEDIRRRAKRNLDIEKDRLARQEAYRRELQEIQDEIAHEKRLLEEAEETEEQKKALQQHRAADERWIAKHQNLLNPGAEADSVQQGKELN